MELGRDQHLFLWGSDSDSRVRKFRTLDSYSGTKKDGLQLRARNQTPIPDLLRDIIIIVYLK